jgi:uncharacterized protein (DUF488 family)
MADGGSLFTIGHSTRTLAEFCAMLEAAHVDCIADVRRFPRSRRHPHFNGDALAASLSTRGIAYRHFEALGGRRQGRGALSPHTLWREEMFRNYADHAETPEFRAALSSLLDLAAQRRVAILCAEAVWWRCHRRIVADYCIAAGARVTHILDKDKLVPAQLTSGAQIRGGAGVLYAGAQSALPL